MPSSAAAPRARGEAVERAAENYLQQQGLQSITHNFQRRGGEIDLIMREGATLVFVEVRFRKTDNFGSPVESVTPSKQRKLLQTAQLFLLAQPQWRNAPCRFDIVAARPAENDAIQFERIKNAFGA